MIDRSGNRYRVVDISGQILIGSDERENIFNPCAFRFEFEIYFFLTGQSDFSAERTPNNFAALLKFKNVKINSVGTSGRFQRQRIERLFEYGTFEMFAAVLHAVKKIREAVQMSIQIRLDFGVLHIVANVRNPRIFGCKALCVSKGFQKRTVRGMGLFAQSVDDDVADFSAVCFEDFNRLIAYVAAIRQIRNAPPLFALRAVKQIARRGQFAVQHRNGNNAYRADFQRSKVEGESDAV